MNLEYARTVQLLLAVAPGVFQNSVFAMKGGTALNLSVQDMCIFHFIMTADSNGIRNWLASNANQLDHLLA